MSFLFKIFAWAFLFLLVVGLIGFVGKFFFYSFIVPFFMIFSKKWSKKWTDYYQHDNPFNGLDIPPFSDKIHNINITINKEPKSDKDGKN